MSTCQLVDLNYGWCVAAKSKNYFIFIKCHVLLPGEIICQKKLAISKDVKLPELTEELSDMGADMLVECIKRLPDSLANAKPQSEDGVTYGLC